MQLSVYQVDAFAEKSFEGNPAAVVPLEQWLPDALMQSIAEENNLAETAFFVPESNGFYIRWFTPTKEVKLCGHATLAAAFVLFNQLGYKTESITFNSLSGELLVRQQGDLLTLDFPTQAPRRCEIPQAVIDGLGVTPIECYKNEDYLAVFESEEVLAGLSPNHAALEKLDLRGVIVTAPSANFDFVARFFAPKFGIPEDPVTGSAYTQLTPYWSNRLGKTTMIAKQISSRGGKLVCELKGERVLISGKAIMYMQGSINI